LRDVVPGFDRLDGLVQRLAENALAGRPEYEAEEPALEVLPSRTTTASRAVVPLGCPMRV
jgi:hypothetical protein